MRLPARLLHRVVAVVRRYGRAQGTQLAGAITYFGFLSLFPLIAIAFALLGYVVGFYPQARMEFAQWLEGNLPGLTGSDGLDLEAIAENGAAQWSAGLAGAAGLLYSGLGWVEALRQALRRMWGCAPVDRPLVVRKLRDVVVLVLLGGAVLVTTAVSGVTSSATGAVLDVIGLSGNEAAGVLVPVSTIVLAVLADTVLLVLVFRRLTGLVPPMSTVWTGAVLGAVALEVLKQLGALLLCSTTSNPLYGSFAVVVGVLVWINLVCRAVLYAAAWVATTPDFPVPDLTAVEAG